MGEQVSGPPRLPSGTRSAGPEENLAGPPIVRRKGPRVLPAHPHGPQSHADDSRCQAASAAHWVSVPTLPVAESLAASQLCPFSRCRLYKGEAASGQRTCNLTAPGPSGPLAHLSLPWRHSGPPGARGGAGWGGPQGSP